MSLYYYNNEPLQHWYNNDYSPSDKLNITVQIQEDFKNALISTDQLVWIIKETRFGDYSAKLIIDRLMFEGKLKYNPVTMDTRKNIKERSAFDI